MNEREALLGAIAAAPADDVVRLAFADWLDEHDESNQAEFIRLQIERVRSRSKPKSACLPRREQQLLDKHEAEWLGPLAALKSHEGFSYTVRRGFIETATIHGRLFAEGATALREHCPALTELDVVGVRGFGEQIAQGVPGGIRALRLEDWPLPNDAKAIAKSPHFSHLESLAFWVGSDNDEKVCRAFGASRAFPALKRIELVQVRGGLDAGDEAPRLDARSDVLASVVDSKRKHKIATVLRPCSELLPLASYVGWNLHGGTLPDGRQALIHARIENNEGDCNVFYFDAAGNLLSGEVIEVTGQLRRKPDYRGYDESELYALMAKRMGFRPGMIHVHEFAAEQVIPDCWTRIYKYDGDAEYFVESADSEFAADYDSREEQIESVIFWYHDGNFCITHGGDAAWAGSNGTIHTT